MGYLSTILVERVLHIFLAGLEEKQHEIRYNTKQKDLSTFIYQMLYMNVLIDIFCILWHLKCQVAPSKALFIFALNI